MSCLFRNTKTALLHFCRHYDDGEEEAHLISLSFAKLPRLVEVNAQWSMFTYGKCYAAEELTHV